MAPSNQPRPTLKLAVSTGFAEELLLQRLGEVPGVQVLVARGEAALLEAIGQVDGLVMAGVPQAYTAAVADRLRAGSGVRWLQLMSAGYEGLERHGLPPSIELTGVGAGYSSAVAEHALALMLGLTRGLHHAVRQQIDKTSDRAFAKGLSTLAGRRLVVLGLGAIGAKIATAAAALGMAVTGLNRSGRPLAGPFEVRPLADLMEVLPEADVVVLALPLSPGTRHILNVNAFARMAPGVLVINVGRGELIDHEALVEALLSGRLGGAGLDVTDPEPLPADHVLWSAPNVILTPHIGGAGDPKGVERMCAQIAENAARLMAGQPLLNRLELSERP